MELVQADLIRWLLNLRPFHSVSALTAVEGFIAADGTVSNVLSFIESLHPCIGPAIHAPVLTDVWLLFSRHGAVQALPVRAGDGREQAVARRVESNGV